MVTSYTDETAGNRAVSSLLDGSSFARVLTQGQAAFGEQSGPFSFRVALGILESTASANLYLLDSGDPDSYCVVNLRTFTLAIADGEGSITATNLDTWVDADTAWFSWSIDLPEPVGVWEVKIETNGNGGYTPMYFSDWSYEPLTAPSSITNAMLDLSKVDASNHVIGFGAGAALTTGDYNYAAGYQAGYANTAGSTWYASGYRAGYSSLTGSYWYASGYEAGYNNTTGGGWHASGLQAGRSNTTGSNWYASGALAAYSNTTGINWYASGYQAGYSNTTGGNWYASGNAAGYSNTTGSTNCFVGYRSGYASTTGSNCTYVGSYEGTGYETVSGVVAISGGSTLRYFFDGTNYFFGQPGSINLPTSAPTTIGAFWCNAGVVNVVIA